MSGSESDSDNEEKIQHGLNLEVACDEEDDQQRKTIRENISTLSFEELIKMKETLGSKVYNQAIFDIQPKKSSSKLIVKRANKNRPREVSSKIRLNKFRQVLNGNSEPAPKNVEPLDPRFDPKFGDFDKDNFKKNYQFVNELREQEKIQLQEEYQECSDPARRKTIKLLIQRIENQLREGEKEQKQKQKEQLEKQEIRKQIKHGEKPAYKKKSVKTMENLVEKYEELKKTNRLQKHMQKKTKKLKAKDRKMMEKIK